MAPICPPFNPQLFVSEATLAHLVFFYSSPVIDGEDDYDSRLEVFLKHKLTSPAIHGNNEDPYGICQSSHRAAAQAARYGRQAEAIRQLHKELSEQLKLLRGNAQHLSLHDDDEAEVDDDDVEIQRKASAPTVKGQ